MGNELGMLINYKICLSLFLSFSLAASLLGCVLSVLGQMVRGRSVVLRAAGEGRPCPEQLTQHRSCPVKPCYSWLLGPWSPCTVQVGLSPELPCAWNGKIRHLLVGLIAGRGLEVWLWLVEGCREEGEVQEW